jgi:hypothetical protein
VTGTDIALEEASMNQVIRQFHRWVAVAFTVTVVATVVALAQEEPLVWVSYTPLFPLALLFFSGAYLFARPYLARRRSAPTGS